MAALAAQGVEHRATACELRRGVALSRHGEQAQIGFQCLHGTLGQIDRVTARGGKAGGLGGRAVLAGMLRRGQAHVGEGGGEYLFPQAGGAGLPAESAETGRRCAG